MSHLENVTSFGRRGTHRYDEGDVYPFGEGAPHPVEHGVKFKDSFFHVSA